MGTMNRNTEGRIGSAPKALMPVGIPGAGKTTLAENIVKPLDSGIHSKDRICDHPFPFYCACKNVAKLLLALLILLSQGCGDGSDTSTTDTISATVGGGGALSFSDVSGSSVTVNWTAATDEKSAQADLEYLVYYSTSDNIDTVANAETNGTAVGAYAASITTKSVASLADSTTYYFNVIVMDEAGNQACYTSGSQATADATSPTVGGGGTLSFSGIAGSAIMVNWTAATDNISTQSALEYLVYYSTSDNIDSVADAEANGTAVGAYAADIKTKSVASLADSTTYYFNVIVMDEAGNKACYTSGSQATADASSPTAGGGGTLSFSGVTTTSVTVNCTAATDNVSAQSALEYLVYYSTSDNIDSVADAETNGTAVGAYAANITTKSVASLADSTTYYFNVIVMDEAGNKACYTSGSQATADATSPTAGGGGTLSFSGVTGTSITVNWTVATDDVSAQVNLEYLVYYSTSDNIDTVANAETNGTAVGDYAANIATKSVAPLAGSTTYYFNVIVRDEAGNKACYTSGSQATADATSPTVGGSGTLSFSGVTSSSITVNWTAATDNISAQSALEYLVYYSTSDNIDSVANAETNGTAVGDYAADITTKSVASLADSTTYYFNVIVRDEAGNKACYTSGSQATADATSPTAGGGGTLSFSGVTTTSVTVNCTAATDNVSAQSALEYLVYYSTSDNIDSVANAEANGTAVGAYAANITTKSVASLADSTTYYFNVIVRDEAGNQACYTSGSQATADATSPTAGGGGTLSFSGISGTSVTVNWTAATDNVSAQSALEYLVYYSTSDNIDSVADAEANGTAVGAYAANIATKSVASLADSTTYYFNVIVRDEAGNQACYTSGSQATADATNPTAGGGGTLSFSGVSGTSVTVNWTAATDNLSAQADLEYLVYYSTSDNIDSVANAKANGTAVGAYAANITTKSVASLADSTTYYFNVIVRDEAGNKACYTSGSQATADATSPTVGGSGTLSFSGVTTTSVTVNWTAATDNVSAQPALEYLVYYSTSDNIGTVGNAEANGTAVAAYAADITTKSVASLADSTTYYFNVIVRDEAGNKACYTSGSQATTADVTSPTVGGGGTLSFSDVSGSSITVNWTAATDNVSAQADLEYLVYYSTSDNIDSVADAEANGTAVAAYAADITTKSVASLADSTTYYFNVIVRDEAGNKAAYTSNFQATTTPYLYRAEYDDNQIVKSNLDGTGATVLVADAGATPSYGPIAIAAGGGYIFWSTDNPLTIHRVNTDGAGQSDNLIDTGTDVLGLYVDVASAKLYWADYESNSIKRADLDGSNIETVISNADNSGGGPYTVVVDATYVYWTTDSETALKRALLDGSGVTTLVGGITVPGLGIDTVNGKLYYADYVNGKIVETDLDGSNASDVATGLCGPGNIDGLEYYDGKVYWNDDCDMTVLSHNADGTGSSTAVDSDGSLEYGVCIDD